MTYPRPELNDHAAPRWEPSFWLRRHVTEPLSIAYGDWVLSEAYARRLTDWRPGAMLHDWMYGARRLIHRPAIQTMRCHRCDSRTLNVRAVVEIGAACGPHGVVHRGEVVLCGPCLDVEGIELSLAAEFDLERLLGRVEVH